MTKKENLLSTIRRDHPRFVPYRYDGCLTVLRPLTCVRPVDGGKDDWGCNWTATNEREGSYPDEVPAIALEDVEQYQAPDTDFESVTNDLRKQIDARAGEDTLLIAYNELTLFERAQLLLSTNEYLMAVAANPEAVGRLLDLILEYQIALTKALMKSGVAGVRFTDDWGMQNSLFVRPEQWRILIKPRMKRLYEVVKESGGLVFQHSCGCIDDIVLDLIEIGVDVLDPCQPAANDIFGWKRQYGERLSFMGGLDTQGYLSLGTPEVVKAEVKHVLTMMSPGGGFIAAPSHSITIPRANRQAMVQAIDEFNRHDDSPD